MIADSIPKDANLNTPTDLASTTAPTVSSLNTSPDGLNPVHIVLARKYRPQRFSQVSGQDLFVRMIRTALQRNRIGHGLLLTGIRGIGKTTLARLIAKAVSCAGRDDQQEPCGTCPSCQAFAADNHLDVIEMDAASHTGVEDIRAILDTCQYRPVMGPFRLFIIDEVHMLSKSAFNALLKTLEEPPSHVKFILATTELQKVPATVVSRCQHLPLRRFPTDLLADHLTWVAQQEGCTLPQDCAQMMAVYSQGSARDGLSLLERAMVTADHPILSTQLIQGLLGLPQRTDIDQLAKAILAQDSQQVLDLARQFAHAGLEAEPLLTELLRTLHDRICQCLAHQQPFDHLDRLFQLAQRGLGEVQNAPFAWLTAELVLLRMVYIGQFPSPAQALALLETSWKNLAGQPATAKSEPVATPMKSLTSQAPTPNDGPVAALAAPTATTPGLTLDSLLEALEQAREGMLYAHVAKDISFVGLVEESVLALAWVGPPNKPPALTSDLENFLAHWQKKPMNIHWQEQPGQPTAHARDQQQNQQRKAQALEDPLLQHTQALFPDATLQSVDAKPRTTAAPGTQTMMGTPSTDGGGKE
jgi:DNA polymerase III subunit gamma/tau